MLDLLFEILFQLVDVFYTFFVPYFRHLTQLLNGCRIFEIYLVNLFHNFFGTTFAERTFFLVCLLIHVLFSIIDLLIRIYFQVFGLYNDLLVFLFRIFRSLRTLGSRVLTTEKVRLHIRID